MAARQEDECWTLQDSAAAAATAALAAPNITALGFTAATVTAGPGLEALFYFLFFGSRPESS